MLTLYDITLISQKKIRLKHPLRNKEPCYEITNYTKQGFNYNTMV